LQHSQFSLLSNLLQSKQSQAIMDAKDALVGLVQRSLGRATTLLQQGKHHDCLDSMEKALQTQASLLRSNQKETGIIYLWIGKCLCHQKKYADSLVALEKGLMILELLVGRYDMDTCELYRWIGGASYHLGDPDDKALSSFRIAKRIARTLRGDFYKHFVDYDPDHMTNRILREQGFSSERIKKYHDALDQSTSFEINGDVLCEHRNWKKALEEYENAAKVEAKTFGKHNPTLAFLCRKIACIYCIREEGSRAIFFDSGNADALNHTWFEASQESDLLNHDVCEAIKRGDALYVDALYADANYRNAIAEYRKAQIMTATCPPTSSTTAKSCQASPSTNMINKIENLSESCSWSMGVALDRIDGIVEMGDKETALSEYRLVTDLVQSFLDELCERFALLSSEQIVCA
jgi:tetratricopeptide (TPR) repeat protein